MRHWLYFQSPDYFLKTDYMVRKRLKYFSFKLETAIDMNQVVLYIFILID